MLQTFKNAWKVQELRKKILFTLMIILLYRIGASLFVPFVDVGRQAVRFADFLRFLRQGGAAGQQQGQGQEQGKNLLHGRTLL